ncbi:MAG: M48 family metallopeptidase [Firmicutes bacterium]|nr:M48 family metallopeptidase [Bacillota bacterium]
MKVFEIPLRIVPEERKTVTASFDGSVCLIRIPIILSRQKKRSVEYVDRIYWKMLGQILEPKLKARTNELNCTFFGFEYQKVRYHRQFRRWGSCSSLRNINLSHRLIGAPQSLVDYVIIHELAHLKFLDHSRAFWELVVGTGYDPRSCRKEIQQYGSKWYLDYQRWLNEVKLIIEGSN